MKAIVLYLNFILIVTVTGAYTTQRKLDYDDIDMSKVLDLANYYSDVSFDKCFHEFNI